MSTAPAVGRYLPIYLNDHLAGATVGVELTHFDALTTRANEQHEAVTALHQVAVAVIDGRARDAEEALR